MQTQTSSCYPLHRNRATLFEKPLLYFLVTRQGNRLSPNPISPCNPTEKGAYLQVMLFLGPEKLPFVTQVLQMPLARAPSLDRPRLVTRCARRYVVHCQRLIV